MENATASASYITSLEYHMAVLATKWDSLRRQAEQFASERKNLQSAVRKRRENDVCNDA